MACPTLEELPPPPKGKSGWPWTEGAPRLPDVLPDGRPWPRISVVTPSFNERAFIEETLRSLLLQGYPDLECIVIDGGSTDGTVDVIRAYERWLTCWVSEPDKGQSDALNKGFARASGEVFAYLNSDDIYLPGTLAAVGRAFAEPEVQWVSGPARMFGPLVGPGYTWPRRPSAETWEWLVRASLCQPSTFWRREAARRIGRFDTGLKVCMDYDYWLRLLKAGCTLTWTDRPLSGFRVHSGSTTGSLTAEFSPENAEVRRRHMDLVPPESRAKVERAATQAQGRRYRWRAWRCAWGGRPGAAAADLAGALRRAPGLALHARTWAIVPLVALSFVWFMPRRLLRAARERGASGA